MSNLEEKIAEVLNNDIVNRHSYFQLKYFVVNKEPTHQSKLWRCIRELQSRQEGIESIENEIENLKDDLELLELYRDKIGEDKEGLILLRKHDRKINSTKKSIDRLSKRLKETKEEAEFFLKSFQELEKIESLLPFDDFKSQHSYWSEKLAQEINLRSLLEEPISYEIIKTILSLNNDSPIKTAVINMLERKKQLLGVNVQLKEEENGD